MYISRTPFRVSFFGGGTDFPHWYKEHGGAVLSTTIDKYCYISCRYLPAFFDSKHRVVWSHIESVNRINDILHPAVRAGLKYLGFDETKGVEIHHQGDLPARTGMGSSSAFAVGLLRALSALKEKPIGKKELALQAIDLEQNHLKESGGCQDQIAVSYGGFNYIRFLKSGNFVVDPLSIDSNRKVELNSRLLLFYTGTTHEGPRLANQTQQNISKSAEVLHALRDLVTQSADILSSSQPIHKFGKLLHTTWELKCKLNTEVTNPLINKLYSVALNEGALGGKLLGSGGSGFMLFFAEPNKHAAIKKALSHYIHVPFQFDETGSTLIHNLHPNWETDAQMPQNISNLTLSKEPPTI